MAANDVEGRDSKMPKVEARPAAVRHGDVAKRVQKGLEIRLHANGEVETWHFWWYYGLQVEATTGHRCACRLVLGSDTVQAERRRAGAWTRTRNIKIASLRLWGRLSDVHRIYVTTKTLPITSTD